jgi:hypothetical protein
MSPAVLFVLLAWAGCALWSAKIMEKKGHSKTTGAILGLLLGLFGVIICAFHSTTDEKKAEEYARLRSIYKD